MSFAVVDDNRTAIRQDAAWLDAHWMPFTGNRNFKANPRMVVGAQGAYYTDADGRKIFDGLSGLWCSGLGHGRKEVAEAIVWLMSDAASYTSATLMDIAGGR